MSYETQRDKLTGKGLVVVYDFPDLNTRFVSDRNSSGLSNPVGWTIFDGAKSLKEDGSSFSVRSGQLKVGGHSFAIVDANSTVTAWVSANDLVLANARVEMKIGFKHTSESEWPVQVLVLEDWETDGQRGGGYQFELGNILSAMGVSVFEDIGGSSVNINEIQHAGGLDPTETFIVLDEDDDIDDWPDSGLALLVDEDAQHQELIHYGSKSLTGQIPMLDNITRRYYGTGNVTHVFSEESGETDIIPVWAMRGGVGELAFRILTTTDAAGDSEPSDLGLTNPYLESWLSATNLENWAETTTGGTVNREVSDHIVGFSAVRMDRTGSGTININRSMNESPIPGKWYIVSMMVKSDQPLTDGVQFRIRNITQALDLDTDGSGTSWVGSAKFHGIDTDTDVRRATVIFQWDASFNPSDDLYISILHGATGVNPSSLWFDVGPHPLVYGPFDSQPNGPFDVGDGNGLGLDIEYFNIDHMENILQTYWPHPTFTSQGTIDTGDGALFVEKSEIKNARKWVEDLLRSFGMKPVLDNLGRWTIDKLYRIPPDNVDIGTEWRSSNFKAKWKRGYPDAVNSVTFGTDWNASSGEYERPFPAVRDEDSVAAFGEQESIEFNAKGLRTGLLGFPDLNGETIARKAATRLLLEMANPSTPIDIEPFLKYKDVSLLNTVNVVIPIIPDLTEGTRQDGTREFHVVRVSVDASKGYVRMRIRERRVLNRPAIVGPNSLSGVLYSAATDSQKQYCAVAPDENGFPSDSTLPYTVPP